MKKFVAVMNIPSPYRLHLLGELPRRLKERGVGFHCHFMNRGHKDRPARLEEVKGLVPFFGLLTPEMLKGWKIVLMGRKSKVGNARFWETQGAIRRFLDGVL